MANPTNPPTGPSKSDLDMLSQQSALYAEMSSSVKSLADSINKIVGAVRGTTGEVEDLSNGLAAMAEAAVNGTNDIATATNNAINSSEEGARKAKATIEGLTSVSEEAGDAISRFAKELAIKEATFNLWEAQDTLEVLSETSRKFGENFEGAFTAANAKVVSLVSGVGVLATGLFNIGKAVLAIPFQLLSLAAEEGNELLSKGGGGGDNSFQLALEDIREQFGNIATNEGKAVVDMYNNISQQQKDVAGSGLSMSTIFGKSSEALKAMGDVAKGLGAQFSVLKEQLSESASEVSVLQKGMGLGNEELQAFGSLAISSGKPMVGFLRDAGKQAVVLGKQFGINSNLIGKDLAYMAANSSKFGKMTMQAMGTAATYARKLGLEIKDLEGIMGVFDDFESGAQASAKLSQAFGVQIDSMKMMQASSPAEQMSMLRDAFAKSGKSLEGLTRQQRKYLADTTGLGDKLEQALSPANAGADLGKIQDAATQAANDTNNQLLKQNELIKALATNIKKLPKEGGGGGGDEKKDFTSFIDAFKAGFMGALKEMSSFKKMTMNIAGSMKEFYGIGKKVFEYFLNAFPQLNDIFGGIADIFDPKKFKLAGKQLTDMFKSLFEGLKNPATASKAFGDFYDSFIKWFKGLFGKSESKTAVEKGIEELVGYMGNALSGFVEFLVPKIADMISSVADFLSDPSGAMSSVGKAANEGIGGAISKALVQVGESLMKMWPTLKEALVKLLDVALEELKPYALKALAYYFGYVFVTGIVAGLLQAAGSAIVAKAAQKLMEALQIMQSKAILKFMGKGNAVEQAAAAGPARGPDGRFIGKQGAQASAAVQAGAPAGESKGIIKSIAEINPKDIIKAAGNLILMAAGFLVTLAVVIGGLGLIGMLVLKIGPEALIAGLVATGAVLLALAGVIQVTKLLKGAATAAAALTAALPLAGVAALLLTGFVLIAGLAAGMGVTPELALSLGLVLVGITGALVLVALAAYALMAVAPDGGLTAAGALVIVGTVLLAAMGVFTLAVMAFLKIGPDQSEVKKAEEVMKSLTMIVGAVVAMVGAALLIGLALLSPMTLLPIVAGIAAIGGFLVLVGPAIEKIVKAFEGVKVDPGAVEQKIKILKDVFVILDPMFKMVEKVMDQSTSWFTGTDTAAKNVKTQLDSISGFFDTVLGSLGKFVYTVIEASRSISTSEEELRRAEVFGKILGPVSELAGSLMGAIGGIETNAEEYGWRGNVTKKAVTMKSQLDAIKGFLLGPDGLLKSITGVLPGIVSAVNEMTSLKGMSAKELETLGKKAELVGAMVGAIGDLTRTFSDVARAAAEIGKEKKVEDGVFTDTTVELVDMSKIKTFVPQFTGLVDSLGAVLPKVVDSFNKLPAVDLKGAKDPTVRVQAITGLVSSMMGMMNDITSLPKVDAAMFTNLTSGMKSIGGISDYMGGVESAVTALDKFAKSNLVEMVTKSVETIRKIDNDLASIETISLHSRIEKVGQALSMKPESLKIENKPVNINIQLHFTMDAKDLAMETTAMQARLSTQGQIKNPFNATVKPQ